MTIEFNGVSFATAVVTLGLTIPAAVLALRSQYIPRRVAVMLLFVLIGLALAGVVGSLGRLVDTDPALDQTIRILLIACRTFVIWGLINVIYVLYREGPLSPMHRRASDPD